MRTQKGQRAVALITAVFVLLVLLLTAGHAAHHLHEDLACSGCPVCVHLSALTRPSLEKLLLCALIALSCYVSRCRVGRYGQSVWPRLCFDTPVSFKIKLTI